MPFPIIPAIGLGLQAAGLLSGIGARKKQERANMKLAQFQADANERYLQMQLDYNTPANQMKRYQEAGLNPHLVYGQGSPGNQNAPLTYPDIKTTDYQRQADRMMQVMPMINQTRMVDAQVQAQKAGTIQKYAMTQVNKLQAEVLERNPLLNDHGFLAILSSLRATATSKTAEADMASQMASWMTHRPEDPMVQTNGVLKMQREFDLLDQRFNLGQLDAKLKAKVLTSKEFQNAILEIQKKFMADGDYTSGHIIQFIQLLLLKSIQ